MANSICSAMKENEITLFIRFNFDNFMRDTMFALFWRSVLGLVGKTDGPLLNEASLTDFCIQAHSDLIDNLGITQGETGVHRELIENKFTLLDFYVRTGFFYLSERKYTRERERKAQVGEFLRTTERIYFSQTHIEVAVIVYHDSEKLMSVDFSHSNFIIDNAA